MARCRPTVASLSALLFAVPVIAAQPSAASPVGACTKTVGTIVAVDFGHWGGPIVRGCGVDEPSGFALLHAAGFTTTFDQHDGPASICRIGSPSFDNGTQYPTAADDRCVVTPPTSAYWSYWLAAKGQNTWTYSQYGATADTPKAGEVQLWQFGGTNASGTSDQPAVSPSSLRPTNPRPTGVPTPARPSTSHRASAKPSPTSPARTTHSSTRATASTSASASSTTRTTAPVASHHPTHITNSAEPSAPVTTPSGGAASPRIVNAVPTAVRRTSHGSSTGLLVGAILALLVGGGAGWAAWRRRSQQQ